jgi:predicted lipoprotein
MWLMVKKGSKYIKYILGLLALGFMIYHSIYFESLEKVRHKEISTQFNAKAFATDFWESKLLKHLNNAVDVVILLELFSTNMPEAVNRYAHTLGVSSQHAYLIKGQGIIKSINSKGLLLSLTAAPNHQLFIATSEIFGNAVRDASGLLDVSDFPSTMEFNTISVEINQIVLSQVVPIILDQAREGQIVEFIGAAEVNEDNPKINPLRIIPIKIYWDTQ